MDDVAFDAVTRRTSLLSLGVAGLAAAFAGPLAASAKNKAKKKLKKKQQQKCQAQVEPCETFTIANCDGDPDCLETVPPCCAFFGTCDVNGFFACLL